ncbi:Intraflagellar transport protein 20, partial [Halocaridina rubra]
ISEFHQRADHFIQVAGTLSAAVESEKMRAIGSRNLIKSMSKQREAQQQQLMALIGEKKLELERLRVQYESLLRTEGEQLEFIEQFIMQK